MEQPPEEHQGGMLITGFQEDFVVSFLSILLTLFRYQILFECIKRMYNLILLVNRVDYKRVVFSPFLYRPVPRKKIRTSYYNFDYFELDVQRDEIEMKRIMRPNFCLYFNKTFSRHGNHGKHGKHGKYLLALP